MESNSTAFLIKIKLRHSLGRPSRSDFVQSEVDITDKRHGSRAFRSSIASNMVNDGISTEMVRKVLGHGTKHAIRHYARLDIQNMRLCPLATPEPTGIFAEMLLWKGGEHHV